MSRILDEEPWDVVVTSRIHVLVTGPTVVTRAFVDELRMRLPVPVVDVTCNEPLALDGLDGAGTVVLHDVDRLAVADQRHVEEWLDMVTGRTQVVSTSSQPLLPLIATGGFRDTLYYRLNTVYSDLHDVQPAQSAADADHDELEFPSERELTAAGTSHMQLSRQWKPRTALATRSKVRDPRLPRLHPEAVFTRDTKLALASCAFGVMIGASSMWLVTGSPVGSSPSSNPTPVVRADEPQQASTAVPQPAIDRAATDPVLVRAAVPTLTPIAASSRSPAARVTRFSGTLALHSKPSGARVSINGKPVGVTPIVVSRLPAGSRVVRVTTDGYRPWSSAVRIVANQRNLVTATLDPMPR